MGASYTLLRFITFFFFREPADRSKVAGVWLQLRCGEPSFEAIVVLSRFQQRSGEVKSCGLVSSKLAVGGRGRQWRLSLRYRERMLHNKVRD